MKNNCIVVDIDGCLADNKELAETCFINGKFDIIKGDALVPNMKVNEWCKELCHNFRDECCELILLTGRPECIRKETELWLIKNHIFYDELIMKPFRCQDDAEFKVNKLKHISNDLNIKFVIDDSPMNVKAMRQAGYLVLQPNHLYGGEE